MNLKRTAVSLMMAAGLALPAASAVAEPTGYLFISSENDNAVSVLDGKTYDLVRSVPTGERPRDMKLSPDRSQLFVLASRDNRVDVIDLKTLEVAYSIDTGDDPEMFDFSSDGRFFYVSNEDDALVSKVDIEAREVVMEIEVGEEPEGILVSPDGKVLYVASEVANMVHIIDTATDESLADIVVGNRPRRFAATPDGSEVWVTNELSGSVSILDGKAHELKHTIVFEPKGFRAEEVTPVGITITGDGKTAYVTLGRANHFAVVDVASREIKDYVLVGNRAWSVALSRDESRLFVVNGLSDDMSVIDTGNNRVLRSVPVGRVPHTVVIDD